MASPRPSANTFETELDELDSLQIGESGGGGGDEGLVPGGAPIDDNDGVPVGALKVPFDKQRQAEVVEGATELFEHPFVVTPDAKWRQGWDTLMICVLIYIGITVPYRLSFDSPAKGFYLVINIFSEIVLNADIVVSFRTAYFDPEKGTIVTDPKLIAHRYLRSWAVLDVPSATPFEILNLIFYVDPSLRLMQMVRLVQLLRVFRVARALKDVQAAFHKVLNSTLGLLHVNISYSAIKIGKLFTGLVIVAHFNACVWYIIGTINRESVEEALEGGAGGWLASFGANPQDAELGWVTYYGYGEREPFDMYIISFYYVFTCMTTVGFGDITPHTITETVFSIYTMFIGCTVFGYIVGVMSSEASAGNTDEEYLQKIDYLDSLMKTHNVKTSIRRRIQRHYTYLKDEGTGWAHKEIFPELPHSLRRDLVLSINQTDDIELAQGLSIDYEFVAELQLIMRPTQLLKHEMICRIGELSEEVFVLKSGTAQIFHPPSARAGRAVPIKMMKQGQSFGEESLLGRRRYEFTARCMGTTVLYLIHAKAMADLLSAFPAIRRELRERAARKLKELHHLVRRGGGAQPGPLNLTSEPC